MVMRAAVALTLLCAAPMLSQAPTPAGTTPKPTAEGYPAQAAARNTTIGAEYMLHSFSGRGQMFTADDYLVIEVALYPARGGAVKVSTSQFALRRNGKKDPMLPQEPWFVAGSLKYADWSNPIQAEAGVGMGNAGVILGRPAPVERFPGDPTARPGRKAPRAPEATGTTKREPDKPEDVVVESALPEGEFHGPVSGFLYFPFKGKPKSIKSLELLYAGPDGKATLKLI